MAITTSVPAPTFGPNGFSAPAESAILTGRLADINAAFGGNVNPGLTTPQGQLASSDAAIIGDCNDKFCALANGVDPAFATGRMQDAIGRLYFLTRNPAQATTVNVECVGAATTPIPVGASVKMSDGNLYLCTEAGTIPTTGSILLPFQCSVTGPIACPENFVAGIYSTIPGWDTAQNPTAGVVGRNVESPQAFEQRRQQSVAVNAVSIPDAILGNVLSVNNVLDAYCIDNPTGAPVTIGGVTLAAHSVYVSAVGGEAQAIAQAIWLKKSLGCAYNGAQSQTVYDPNPQYQNPPAYTVQFDYASDLTINFNIVMKAAGAPANALALVQAALQTAFAGEDGGPIPRIGVTLFALRFYGVLAAAWSGAQVISIGVGSADLLAASVTASIAGTALTVSSVASGALAAGQFLSGPNIADGTYVVSGSGSSWTVYPSQTAASATVSAIAANLPDLTPNINQEPVFDANCVQLALQ